MKVIEIQLNEAQAASRQEKLAYARKHLNAIVKTHGGKVYKAAPRRNSYPHAEGTHNGKNWTATMGFSNASNGETFAAHHYTVDHQPVKGNPYFHASEGGTTYNFKTLMGKPIPVKEDLSHAPGTVNNRENNDDDDVQGNEMKHIHTASCDYGVSEAREHFPAHAQYSKYNDTAVSFSDIEKRHKGHFFSPDATKNFKSIYSTIGHDGPGGVYFTTSEKGPDNVRRQTVRKQNKETGDITTVGPRGAYSSWDEAENAAHNLAKGTIKEGIGMNEAVLNEEDKWTGAVTKDVTSHPKAGLYASGSGPEIAKSEEAREGSPGGAIKAINFYKERAGTNLSGERKAALNHAIAILHEKLPKK